MKKFYGALRLQNKSKLFSLLVICAFIGACKKDAIDRADTSVNATLKQGAKILYAGAALGSSLERTDSDNPALSTDTTVKKIVLGATLLNPYTLPNMTQAFQNVYGQLPPNTLSATDRYIQFSPSNESEFIALLEDKNIEKSSYPLDKIVVSSGSYYEQAGVNFVSTFPVIYSVVPMGTVLPAVPYQVIAQMYIPKSSPIWEQEAFKLTNNDDFMTNDFKQNRASIINTVRQNPCSDLPLEFLSLIGGCNVESEKAARGSQKVHGIVEVENYPACPSKWRPIRKVKVIIRGGWLWLKRDVVYADNNGSFTSDKNFSKAKFELGYRNDFGRVIPYSNGWQYIWNFMDELKPDFPFILEGSALSNVQLRVGHNFNPQSDPASYWCGAVIHNGLIEQHEMCLQEGIQPPFYLHVVLHQKDGAHHAGTRMMHYVNGVSSLATFKNFLESLGINLIGALSMNLLTVYGSDVKFGCGSETPEMGFFNTDRYCELIYHEFGHASHCTKVGPHWWVEFGLAEYNNPGPPPYGNGDTYYHHIIAVGEAWAYHIGHYMAQMKWGNCTTTFPEQGDIDHLQNVLYFSNAQQPALNSQLNFLENFEPDRVQDPMRWIPKGLMWDLMDEHIDNSVVVMDSVYFFTNKVLFHAMNNDIKNMQQFRDNLIQEVSGIPFLNAQKNKVINLFKEYHYE